jgi:hypothetical protein
VNPPSKERNIPEPTSMMGATQPPKLVPAVNPLRVGARNEEQDQDELQRQPAPAKGNRAKGRTPRRPGRPRGPERVPLSVRILAENDRKLTAAVDETGLNPQTIVDEALSAYFKRLKIKDPGEAQDS